MSPTAPDTTTDGPLTSEDLKRRAAALAIEEVAEGMVLGLGTGSTVAHFLELLGRRLASGELSDVSGVPTSLWTQAHAERLGIRLTTLSEHGRLDLTVDGADEVGPGLDLIKGMGGALLREKMVAQASRRVIIIADASKRVERLGTLSPLPVEVVEWGRDVHVRKLEALGAEVSLRADEQGRPIRSDNDNCFLDCRFPGGIDDPEQLERTLRSWAGVVETGLFLGLADEALLSHQHGVDRLARGR